MAEAKILVADAAQVAQIKIVGRATHLCSPSFKKFGQHIGEKEMIIDFSECTGMDSTFMGVLTELGLPKFQQKHPITFVNTSEPNKQLLKGLGVHGLFKYEDINGSDHDWETLCNACDIQDKQTHGQVMLEAHETLMEIDENNIPKFEDVVDFLRNDLDEST